MVHKDSTAKITTTHTIDTPAGLNSTNSDRASSGGETPTKKDSAGKTTAPPMAGSSMVPGFMSPDGKCACPGMAPASDSPLLMPDNNTTVSTLCVFLFCLFMDFELFTPIFWAHYSLSRALFGGSAPDKTIFEFLM
ncbi:uncharacterized protein MELLADRAFT_69322 [Melampsora larici-populina 98AG31]|uniref:Uncharacterized protein n=1 Tax=Melampsora larici-populina (strain 98AG31 / pathotype 3-4-7) TaxID=747676 RepID=F4SAA0_MELLP|nr:uncharacterized protein MELLADRAFT_69322 [Melampsora larici-populina 98AG31]EGF98439.1 hypothetical protein MELLADRAFT_69322 [Melampsora larici-populina 98AG31]